MASQRERDDMIVTLSTAVPKLQTDVALVQRDIHYITDQQKDQGKKLDAFATKQDSIIERLDRMAIVTPADFAAYQATINQRFTSSEDKTEKRVKPIEDFLQDNKPGISLSNALVSKWITLLVLLLTAAAMLVGFSKVLPFGN